MYKAIFFIENDDIMVVNLNKQIINEFESGYQNALNLIDSLISRNEKTK